MGKTNLTIKSMLCKTLIWFSQISDRTGRPVNVDVKRNQKTSREDQCDGEY